MASQQGDFIWYELMTPDSDGAKAFYDAVVGWSVDSHSGMADIDYRMIVRADGGLAGGLLGLTEEMRAEGARPAWVGYIAVPDVDAAVAVIEAEHGHLLMPANTLEGVGRMAMVTDPQGAPFYLMTPELPADAPADANSAVFSVDRPGHVRWNELSASDPAAAIDFYGRHFGWVPDGAMDMGELGQYRFFKHGETMIGAVMPLMPGMPASAWSFYFGVTDIDRGAEAVRRGGGTITAEPMQIPSGEYSLSAIDPQGAHFGLVGPRHQGGA